MRILELTPRYPPAIGGVERDVSQLTKWLIARGHGVEVWTSDLLTTMPVRRVASGSVTNDCAVVERMRGYAPPPLGSTGELLVPEVTLRLLEEADRFDAIHAHGYRFFPSFGSILPWFHRHFPLVVSAHSGPERNLPRRVYDALFQSVLRKAVTRIICESEVEATLFRESGWGAKVRVIAPGISPDFFRSPSNSNTSVPSEAIEEADYLFALGRLAPNKGFDVLIQAAAPLLEADPALRLVIAGEDHGYLPTLQREARRYGVHRQVLFPGRISETKLLQYLYGARLFVFPSISGEAWGFALLEAMASGRAVVATRLPGPAAMVKDGKSGYLVDVGDPAQLRGRIKELLADRPLCDRMGNVGRSIASGYSWEKSNGSVLQVLAEAVEEASGAA